MSPIVKLRDIKQFASLSAILTRVNVRIWCPMTNRGCVRFVLPISLPDRCVRKASVCLMNISSDFDFDRVTKPEMTRASSTLLKYNAVLLSARRAAFFFCIMFTFAIFLMLPKVTLLISYASPNEMKYCLTRWRERMWESSELLHICHSEWTRHEAASTRFISRKM